MAIIDGFNQFSNLQAVTVTAPSTDVVDLKGTYDFGNGENVFCEVRVGTAVAAAGNATVTFELQGSTDLAFTSPITMGKSEDIPKAQLTANKVAVQMRVRPTAPVRYVRLLYTVGTGPLTAGTFDAYLLKDLQRSRAYASGYKVS